MNVITRLQDELATAGLRLRKAQARGEGRLTLEIGTGDGPVCAGQWHADADATERVAARTRALCGAQSVDVLARSEERR
ncbi:MAG: hypothetical protein HOQ45_23645, partial [Nocardioidaceae bacterium]|nr:hypothetical protein [Nocardioidaceae bacterium]